VKKKKLLIICLPLLVILLIGVGYVLNLKSSTRQLLKDAVIIVHTADGASDTLDSSTPTHQEALRLTNKILINTIFNPLNQRNKLTLLVDPNRLPGGDYSEGDYLEVKLKQSINVPGQEARYDRLLFALSGDYEGLLLLHATTDYWGPWSSSDEKEFWSLREYLDLLPKQVTTPALRRTTAPMQSREPLNDFRGALQKLGIKTTDFYKEYIAEPNTFDPDQLALYPEVCRKGAYNLSSYLDQNLTFTGYRTDVVYQFTQGMENEVVKEEPLNVWVISSDSKIVCIYLSVREDSTMAPGIFSVNDPFLKFPSR